MNKRQASMGLLAVLAGRAITAETAQAAVSAEEARRAVMGWLGALRSGDAGKVAKVLAPEFQLVRSDGRGFDASTYTSALPHYMSDPELREFVHTSEGGLLVARYVVSVRQSIGGKPVQTVAPRLTVLRRHAGAWLVSAHANFAQIG